MVTRVFRPWIVRVAICFLFVTPLVPLGGQAPAQQPGFAPNETLPFDRHVVRGTLPNGLTYFIRKNTRPEKRVMLQLAVKAGSVDEIGRASCRERV